MSDFSSDLNTEKLEELQAAIDRLEAVVADNRGDIDRLETIEFFDSQQEVRQVIVHWLEDVEPEDVETKEDAKEKFIEFSEERRGDDKKKQVGHGDILVIGGDCPWYALCAKVDVGLGGGDAGFQDEDPMDVAGTEEENNKAFKEFIVWNSCPGKDGEDGADGEDGEDPCEGQTGGSAAIAGGLTITSGDPSSDSLTVVESEVPNPQTKVTTIIDKLQELALTAEEKDNTEEVTFLALKEAFGAGSSSSSGCPDSTCKGIYFDIVSISSGKTNISLGAVIDWEKKEADPYKLVDKKLNITETQKTLTITNSTLSSDICGGLTVAGGTSSNTNFSSTSVTATTANAPFTIDILGKPTLVSTGTVSLSSSVSIFGGFKADDYPIAGNSKAFLPVLDGCPESGNVSIFNSFWTGMGDTTVISECGSGDDPNTQTLEVQLYPKYKNLEYECGMLVGKGEEQESMGEGVTPVTFEFDMPCTSCDGSNETKTITQHKVSISTVEESGSEPKKYTFQPLTRDVGFELDPCGSVVSISTGEWNAGSVSATEIEISAGEAQDCSGETRITTPQYRTRVVSGTGANAGKNYLQDQEFIIPAIGGNLTPAIVLDGCGKFLRKEDGTMWSNIGTPIEIPAGTGTDVPSEFEQKTVQICEGSQQKTLTIWRAKIT
jgi:hypothetical protein